METYLLIEMRHDILIHCQFGNCIEVPSSNSINPYAAGGYFGQYEIMQKTWKNPETLAHGYSSESAQQELSNEYQHDRV